MTTTYYSLLLPYFLNKHNSKSKHKQRISITNWYQKHGFNCKERLVHQYTRNHSVFREYIKHLSEITDPITHDPLTVTGLNYLLYRLVIIYRTFGFIPNYVSRLRDHCKMGFIIVSKAKITLNSKHSIIYYSPSKLSNSNIHDSIENDLLSGRIVRIDEWKDGLEFEAYKFGSNSFELKPYFDISKELISINCETINLLMNNPALFLLRLDYYSHPSSSAALDSPPWLIAINKILKLKQISSIEPKITTLSEVDRLNINSNISLNVKAIFKFNNTLKDVVCPGWLHIEGENYETLVRARRIIICPNDFSSINLFENSIYEFLNRFLPSMPIVIDVSAVTSLQLDYVSRAIAIYDNLTILRLLNFKKMLNDNKDVVIFGGKGSGKTRMMKGLSSIYIKTFFEDSDLYGYFLFYTYGVNSERFVSDYSQEELDDIFDIIVDDSLEHKSFLDLIALNIVESADFKKSRTPVEYFIDSYRAAFNNLICGKGFGYQPYDAALRSYIRRKTDYISLCVFMHSEIDMGQRINPEERITFHPYFDTNPIICSRYTNDNKKLAASLQETFYRICRHDTNLIPANIFYLVLMDVAGFYIPDHVRSMYH